MDASHFGMMTPDGHDVGSIDVGHSGVDVFAVDGQMIAHGEHLPFLDQLLDAQGHEIASLDHTGTVWQGGHIVGEVHHHAGSDSTTFTTPDGHPEMTAQSNGNDSVSITSPAGIALMTIQRKFG